MIYQCLEEFFFDLFVCISKKRVYSYLNQLIYNETKYKKTNNWRIIKKYIPKKYEKFKLISIIILFSKKKISQSLNAVGEFKLMLSFHV